MGIDLDQISIAKPCLANWNEMSGDERSRHCGMCKLNVYNFSDMTRTEIERLLEEKEGHLCVRLFKRADGTVLTKDCPVGLAKVRRRLAIMSGALAASIFMAAGSVLARAGITNASGTTPARAVKEWLRPPQMPIMGTPGPPIPPTTKPTSLPVPPSQPVSTWTIKVEKPEPFCGRRGTDTPVSKEGN